MTFNKKFLLAGAALSGVILAGAFFGTKVQAADSDLTVEAVIVAAVTIDCATSDLDFGSIAASTAGGDDTVTITPAGARSIAGPGNGILIGAGGDNGTCTVNGANNATVEISLPASTTVTNGTDVLTVNNFVLDTPGGDGASPQTFTSTGVDQDVFVGADLIVTQSASAGNYTGDIQITANYQ